MKLLRNPNLLFGYRLIAFGLCLLGVCLQLGLAGEEPSLRSLAYYTLQSNVLCLLCWLLQLAGVRLSSAIRGGVSISILLTMVVYHFLLSGTHFTMMEELPASASLSNQLLHYITPLLMLTDFFVLDKRTTIHKAWPFLWCTFPLCYLAFALWRGAMGAVLPAGSSSYPYFFIDPAQGMLLAAPQGFLGVALNSALILVAYIGVGYLLRLAYNGVNRLFGVQSVKA